MKIHPGVKTIVLLGKGQLDVCRWLVLSWEMSLMFYCVFRKTHEVKQHLMLDVMLVKRKHYIIHHVLYSAEIIFFSKGPETQ